MRNELETMLEVRDLLEAVGEELQDLRERIEEIAGLLFDEEDDEDEQ